MIKIKKELNYRKAKKKENRCEGCNHFISREIMGLGGVSLGPGYRCEIMGNNESRKYSILPGNICDNWQKSNAVLFKEKFGVSSEEFNKVIKGK